MLLCYFAETLNTLAREHWELFSTQQYFDKTGVFTSLVFSAPLILIALVILVRRRTFLASRLPVAICARICACQNSDQRLIIVMRHFTHADQWSLAIRLSAHQGQTHGAPHQGRRQCSEGNVYLINRFQCRRQVAENKDQESIESH